MKYMKLHPIKLLIYLGFVFGLIALTPALASAAQPTFNKVCTDSNPTIAAKADQSPLCQDQSSSDPILGPNGILSDVTRIITIIAGTAAVILIVISGFQFVISGGDTQRVQSARNTLLYSIVGLVVIVLANLIIGFVLNRVT